MRSHSVAPTSDIDVFSDDVLSQPYEAYLALRNARAVVRPTNRPLWALARYADAATFRGAEALPVSVVPVPEA